MKNEREIKTIERTLEILNKPEKWIKEQIALDEDGHSVFPPNQAAVCWCLNGAIYKALWELDLSTRKWMNSFNKINDAICKVANLPHSDSNEYEHVEFNDKDETTYEMVIDALQKAKEYLSL